MLQPSSFSSATTPSRAATASLRTESVQSALQSTPVPQSQLRKRVNFGSQGQPQSVYRPAANWVPSRATGGGSKAKEVPPDQTNDSKDQQLDK